MDRKLLIADDNDNFARVMTEQFSTWGYKTVSVDNGVDAILMFLEEDIDFVLMDVVMPKMSGIDACRVIKKIDPHVGAILFTGNPDDHIRKEAMDLGVTAFMTKPFSLIELFEKVNGFFSVKD